MIKNNVKGDLGEMTRGTELSLFLVSLHFICFTRLIYLKRNKYKTVMVFILPSKDYFQM